MCARVLVMSPGMLGLQLAAAEGERENAGEGGWRSRSSPGVAGCGGLSEELRRRTIMWRSKLHSGGGGGRGGSPPDG